KAGPQTVRYDGNAPHRSVGEVGRGGKLHRPAADERHGDDEKKHHQGKEKPCPDAAGEENETLHGSADAGGRRPGGRNSSRPAIGHAAISQSAAPCEGARPIPSRRAYLPGTREMKGGVPRAFPLFFWLVAEARPASPR